MMVDNPARGVRNNINGTRMFVMISTDKAVKLTNVMGSNGSVILLFREQIKNAGPVKIVDLAKRMISLSGAKDIEIEYTGLGDGEKLYEEVLSDAEGQ